VNGVAFAHIFPRPQDTRTPQASQLTGDLLDAVFYVLKSGCPWRLLPRDFPPWKTVYDWFRRWRIDGTWERLNAELRERLRWRLGRNPNPSAGIVDSQSVRTTGVGANERGFDPAKKVEGRKRHLLVDTHRGWCSKPRSTAQRSKTEKASRFFWISHPNTFHASAIYGWTPATPEKAKGRTGWREYWGGRRRSCSTLRRWLRRR
jgi:transposase